MKNSFLPILFLAAAACGGEDLTVEEQVEAQIARGGELYGANCAGCHGAMGEGTSQGPAVVGTGVFPKMPRAGAARTVEFMTAADVFVWAKANMPPTAPGTVADEDMLAVFAFDLNANGVTLERPLDAALAGEIVLNP